VIGALRKRLTLESGVRTDDGSGGFTVSWTPVVTLWAEVAQPGGGEGLAGDRLTAERRVLVVFRHRGDVTAAQRFTAGGRVYEIVAVRDADGRGRELHCDCIEREAA
jgi:SPP1 family predicted phage head-tail adaptor